MEELDAYLRTLGAWGYPLLGLAALLEYVFPPFPGDTVTVAGGAWAARSDRSVVLLWGVLTLGSVVGISAMWRIGRAFGDRIALAPDGTTLLGLEVAQIHRAQQVMRDRGGWLLVLNRFLPSFRAVLFLAAGASAVPYARTLVLGTLSAAVFNALLLAVGVTVGDNAEALAAFFSRFRVASFVVLGLVLAIILARWLWRRRAS